MTFETEYSDIYRTITGHRGKINKYIYCIIQIRALIIITVENGKTYYNTSTKLLSTVIEAIIVLLLFACLLFAAIMYDLIQSVWDFVLQK